jgi:RimJ/RimL family protein N-acetyltransferase
VLYRALYTNETVMAEIGPVLSPQAADAACRTMAWHNGVAVPGHRTWVIEGRHEGGSAGMVALHRQGRRAELGLMLLPEAWTGRVSREVLAPVIAYGFNAMSLEHIDTGCRDGRNTRVSRRLLAPFPFEPVPAPKPGSTYWCLARSAWLARAEAQGAVALDPRSG